MASNQQMPTIECNRADHQGEKIRSLCLRVGCDKQSAQCYKCTLELHKECIYSTIMIDDVPNMQHPLLQMKFGMIELQKVINSQIQSLIAQMEKTSQPINQYIETPNISNLNQIGTFLKTQAYVIQMAEIEKVEQIITNLFVDIKKKFSKEISLSLKQYFCLDQGYQNMTVEELKDQGDALCELKNYEEAMKCYQQVILIDPNNLVSWDTQGDLLYNQEKYQQAIECYEQIIKINPQDIQAWLDKGDALFEQEKYNEAFDCYQQIIEMNPNSSIGWNIKGNALFNLGKYQEALECYQQGINIDPKCYKSWLYKGDTLDKLMESNEAMQCFEQATSIDPNNQIAWNYKGDALFKLQQYEEAIQCYQYMIKIDPTNHVAWNNKGYALQQQQKYENALECYKEAIKIDPKYIQALLNKGETLYGLKKYEEAIESYLSITKIDLTNSKANKCLEKILNKLDNIEVKNQQEVMWDPENWQAKECYYQVIQIQNKYLKVIKRCQKAYENKQYKLRSERLRLENNFFKQ